MFLESIVFPVTYLNISKDLALQRLLVEWDVGKSAHDAELAMSFEIQVRRTYETSTMWTVSVFFKKRYISFYSIKKAKGKSNVHMHMQIAFLYRFTT